MEADIFWFQSCTLRIIPNLYSAITTNHESRYLLNSLCWSLQVHFLPPHTLSYALGSFTCVVASWGWGEGGKNNGKYQRIPEYSRRLRFPCSCFWFFPWAVNAYSPLFVPHLMSGDLVTLFYSYSSNNYSLPLTFKPRNHRLFVPSLALGSLTIPARWL